VSAAAPPRALAEIRYSLDAPVARRFVVFGWRDRCCPKKKKKRKKKKKKKNKTKKKKKKIKLTFLLGGLIQFAFKSNPRADSSAYSLAFRTSRARRKG